MSKFNDMPLRMAVRNRANVFLHVSFIRIFDDMERGVNFLGFFENLTIQSRGRQLQYNF